MEKIYIKPEIIIMQMEEQELLANVSKVTIKTVASDSEVDTDGLTPETGSDGITTSPTPKEAKDGYFDFDYSFDADF